MYVKTLQKKFLKVELPVPSSAAPKLKKEAVTPPVK
jgi:hypothetical protein